MPVNNKNITIHIGMPKSASTTLQKDIFSRLENVNYCGPEKSWEGTNLFLELIKQEDSYVQLDKIEDHFNSILDNTKPMICSSEFACSPMSPLASGLPQNRRLIADRFKLLMPNAKILIVLRNQLDLQRSYYAQLLLNEKDFISFKKMNFNKWIEKNIKLHHQNWQTIFQFADYDELITIYQERFDNVKVVLFEEMVQDFEQFVKYELFNWMDIVPEDSILNYTKTQSNKRHSMGNIMITKAIMDSVRYSKKAFGDVFSKIPKEKRERIISRLVRLGSGFGQINTHYSDQNKEFLRAYYASSNHQVMEKMGLDLARYNYPL